MEQLNHFFNVQDKNYHFTKIMCLLGGYMDRLQSTGYDPFSQYFDNSTSTKTSIVKLYMNISLPFCIVRERDLEWKTHDALKKKKKTHLANE